MTIDEVKQYFEDENINVVTHYLQVEHTCRYGVTYECCWRGSYGEIWRAWDLMRRCCCWVCHNHDCKEPKNEIIKDCNHNCDLWTKVPYCENKNK